eukprot:Hpha_TRINITY_DN15582_c3_g4::TRINITY_DN15582_c3_g4_i6::g.105386::m.105386
MLGVCVVFLGDFYFTYGFASGMRLQLRKVQAAVDVAEVIADALARYDVTLAKEALEGESAVCLPEKLRDSLKTLVGHLSMFKSSLPVSVLAVKDTAAVNREDVTFEEPQFLRLHSLFLALLHHTRTG